MNDYLDSVEQTINKTLKEKISLHRKRFVQIFKARYMEMLPSLIKYQNERSVAVDFLKVEVALRNGYDVVIGDTKENNIQVLGYTKARKAASNPESLFSDQLIKHKDIHFTLPKRLRLPYYKEISYFDSCESGNFVVLRNKSLNYVPDTLIIEHYVDELSEIVLSRYSISMQIKISTLFTSEVNDQTIEQLISDIYNGNPYIKTSKLFDPEDNIYHMKNEHLAQNFQELKREYQNKISELNNMIGMNSLAVEKSSGVSDEEVKGNRAFTTSNANIALDGRNHGLKKLNKRYGLELEALYNDEVVSEFAELAREEDTENANNDNDL